VGGGLDGPAVNRKRGSGGGIIHFGGGVHKFPFKKTRQLKPAGVPKTNTTIENCPQDRKDLLKWAYPPLQDEAERKKTAEDEMSTHTT